jgi:hypothetical protein
MRYFIFILILLCSAFSFGQKKQNKTANSGFPITQIGLNTSVNMMYRSLKNNNGSSLSNQLIHTRDENEIPKVGYTVGINVLFNLKSNMSVESGIQYANKGYQTKMLETVSFQPNDPLAPEKAKFIYHFHYLDIPLKFNYVFGNRKIRYISSIGVTGNIFLKETQTSIRDYADRTEKTPTSSGFEYERLNISPTISIGIDYKINNKMNFRIEPTFRYGVMKIIDAPITAYLFSGGVNFGFYYGF